MRLRSRLRLWPRTLVSRLILMLLGVILVSQLAAGLLWYRQVYTQEEQGLKSALSSIAESAAYTASYYTRLPMHSRHLILEQNRSMGGNRFFISLNSKVLDVQPLPDSARKQELLNYVRKIFEQKLGKRVEVKLEFTKRAWLRVYDAEVLMEELPRSFSRYTLELGNLDPPILVMQIKLSDNGEQGNDSAESDYDAWFYLAAKLPSPYVKLETHFWDRSQTIFTIITTLLILLCTWYLVRREIRPIRNLAYAAKMLGSQMDAPIVKEEGGGELVAATQAFNKMNRRIRAYLRDREMLFGAISHDLKTPIACLKLRTEMLDDDAEREKFSRVINELEFMVKGALQCMRDTDIHEDIEPLNINDVLESLVEVYNRYACVVTIHGKAELPIRCKPLAVKRMLSNVLDNAIKYGKSAVVTLCDHGDSLSITCRDFGPGIADDLREKVFEPYYRIAQEKQEGTGLGFTIARSICKSHGGHLSLENHCEGGLIVKIVLPREA